MQYYHYILSVIILIVLVSVIAISITHSLINTDYYSDPVSPTRKRYRPLRGGIQITTRINNTYAYSTLGYSARFEGETMHGVVIAAHALSSDIQYVYQPTYSRSNEIGISIIVCDECDAAFVYTYGNLNGEDDVAPYILHIINVTANTYMAVNAVVIGWYNWETLQFLFSIGITTIYRTDRTEGTQISHIVNLSDEYTHNGETLKYVIVYDNKGEPGASGSPLYYYYDNGMGSNAEAVLIGHTIGSSTEADLGIGISVHCVVNEMNIEPLTDSST